MRVGQLRVAFIVAALVVGACWTPADAQAEGEPPIPYRLLDGSSYQEGCFEPCDCYLLAPQPLKGTFALEYLPVFSPIETKGVADVQWFVPSLGKHVTGSGLYRLIGDQQRLVLDLEIDDAPTQTFDSTFVPGGSRFPRIDIVITLHQFYCYDVVMHVVAEPAKPAGPTLTVAPSLLSWQMSEADAGQGFDVVCGDLTVLTASAGDFTSATEVCMGDDLVAGSLPYELPLEAGRGLWFLVRPSDGTYDSGRPSQVGLRDGEIDSSPLGCP